MKQKHKYKVGDNFRHGTNWVTILRRLDNKMYQITYEDWRGSWLRLVSEDELVLNYKKHEVKK